MKINLANIKKAKKLLNKNECVGVPTETVYGLAGNAYSNIACKKIFKLKKRLKCAPPAPACGLYLLDVKY